MRDYLISTRFSSYSKVFKKISFTSYIYFHSAVEIPVSFPSSRGYGMQNIVLATPKGRDLGTSPINFDVHLTLQLYTCYILSLFTDKNVLLKYYCEQTSSYLKCDAQAYTQVLRGGNDPAAIFVPHECWCRVSNCITKQCSISKDVYLQLFLWRN